MKCNITLCLDEEIIKKLKKEDNQSEAVNEQMKAYYNIKDVQNLRFLKENLSKIKQESKENRRKEREIKSQIAKIELKEKEIIQKTREAIKDKPERDPIRDPQLWIERGWDKQFPKEWAKHQEFVRRFSE